MRVLVSNHGSWRTHFLAGRFGGLGFLYPPERLFGPYPHLPYALDNGAYGAWKNDAPWDQGTFERALDWVSSQTMGPMWVVVPDVVGDADETMRSWEVWAPRIRERGFELALAVQDGMTPKAVLEHTDPEVIFVGGTRDWKQHSMAGWTRSFGRVHVGRVNGLRDLMACHRLGVESVDGTGFFRGRRAQLEELITYLREFGDPEVRGHAQEMYLPVDDGHPRLPFPEDEEERCSQTTIENF